MILYLFYHNFWRTGRWKIIPVEEINGEKISAFILRTKRNFHGNKVIELIAPEIDLPNDSAVEIVVLDEKQKSSKNN